MVVLDQLPGIGTIARCTQASVQAVRHDHRAGDTGKTCAINAALDATSVVTMGFSRLGSTAARLGSTALHTTESVALHTSENVASHLAENAAVRAVEEDAGRVTTRELVKIAEKQSVSEAERVTLQEGTKMVEKTSVKPRNPIRTRVGKYATLAMRRGDLMVLEQSAEDFMNCSLDEVDVATTALAVGQMAKNLKTGVYAAVGAYTLETSGLHVQDLNPACIPNNPDNSEDGDVQVTPPGKVDRSEPQLVHEAEPVPFLLGVLDEEPTVEHDDTDLTTTVILAIIMLGGVTLVYSRTF